MKTYGKLKSRRTFPTSFPTYSQTRHTNSARRIGVSGNGDHVIWGRSLAPAGGGMFRECNLPPIYRRLSQHMCGAFSAKATIIPSLAVLAVTPPLVPEPTASPWYSRWLRHGNRIILAGRIISHRWTNQIWWFPVTTQWFTLRSSRRLKIPRREPWPVCLTSLPHSLLELFTRFFPLLLSLLPWFNFRWDSKLIIPRFQSLRGPCWSH